MAKNEEWKQRYEEDWNYVSSMTRFFKWWIKHEFDIDITLEADILPVIPGKIFDRPSLAYLLKDHSDRGNSVFHFYLPYFKPLWTDCRPLNAITQIILVWSHGIDLNLYLHHLMSMKNILQIIIVHQYLTF